MTLLHPSETPPPHSFPSTPGPHAGTTPQLMPQLAAPSLPNPTLLLRRPYVPPLCCYLLSAVFNGPILCSNKNFVLFKPSSLYTSVLSDSGPHHSPIPGTLTNSPASARAATVSPVLCNIFCHLSILAKLSPLLIQIPPPSKAQGWPNPSHRPSSTSLCAPTPNCLQLSVTPAFLLTQTLSPVLNVRRAEMEDRTLFQPRDPGQTTRLSNLRELLL